MYRVFYAILFYFVDYRIPPSQIKIVLFILTLHQHRIYYIRLLFDIMEYAEENDIPGLFLLIVGGSDFF